MRIAIPMILVPLALAALFILATLALVRPAAGAHHPPRPPGQTVFGPVPITREGL